MNKEVKMLDATIEESDKSTIDLSDISPEQDINEIAVKKNDTDDTMDNMIYYIDGTSEQEDEMVANIMKKLGITQEEVDNFDEEAFYAKLGIE